MSPFFGGGSVELALAARRWRVLGFDAFGPLVDFWQVLLTTPHDLAAETEQHFPLARSQFHHLQRTRFQTQVSEAARFFVLNRCSFSGTTMCGGMSTGHPRFTRSAIDRIRHFAAPEVWVDHAAFDQSILQHPDAFLYCDPPYFSASGLYGNQGDLHDGFHHEGLCQLLRRRQNWVLSYDDCPEVRELYRGHRIIELTWKYSMGMNKNSREILILGDGVPDTKGSCLRPRSGAARHGDVQVLTNWHMVPAR